jgi:RNA polymerase primary sigma factor
MYSDTMPKDALLTHYLDKITYAAKKINKGKNLSMEQEAELCRAIRKGDREALDTLVKANLRFVVSVARNYQNQGMPLPDLINEGNIGLISAASRFNYEKSFKFISYAVWWIRQSILQAMAEQSRIVRMPLNNVGKIHKIRKAGIRLEQRYGREVSVEDIAEDINLEDREVTTLINAGSPHLSINNPMKDTGIPLIENMTDDEQEMPDDFIAPVSFRSDIEKILENLEEREYEVIRQYFGINEPVPKTLEEIGQQYNITRERVRQIKHKALKKLKFYAGKERITYRG